MNNPQQVDLNQAACIQHITRIGETVYTNICTGATTTLQWGSVDWMIGLMVGVMCVGLAMCIIGVAGVVFLKEW